MASKVCVFLGDELARYNFGEEHPFGPKRHDAFEEGLVKEDLLTRVNVCEPKWADENQISRFHTQEYIEQVKRQSLSGEGYLDWGDTPAVKGIFEAASTVVGTTLAAAESILSGKCRRAFVTPQRKPLGCPRRSAIARFSSIVMVAAVPIIGF